MTSTELGYLSGVTSNIQTQLDGKANSVHADHPDISCQYIEMGSEYHGGFIDFHYGHSSADYTSRIIEEGDGIVIYSCKLNVKSDVGNLISINPSSGAILFHNLCVDNNMGNSLPSSGSYGQIFFLKS